MPTRATQGQSRRRPTGRRGFSSMDQDSDHDRSERSESNGGRSGRQGFASMDPEKQREIASMGGRASHGGRVSASSQRSRRRH